MEPAPAMHSNRSTDNCRNHLSLECLMYVVTSEGPRMIGLTINTILNKNRLKARSPRYLHNLYCSQIGFSSFNFYVEHCDQPKCAVVGCCSKLSCCNSVVFLLLDSHYYPLQLTLKSRTGTLLFFHFAVHLLPVFSQLVTLDRDRAKSTARINI